jgi:hypothetical protein
VLDVRHHPWPGAPVQPRGALAGSAAAGAWVFCAAGGAGLAMEDDLGMGMARVAKGSVAWVDTGDWDGACGGIWPRTGQRCIYFIMGMERLALIGDRNVNGRASSSK